jgi:sugar lactone lactonase YvrE
MNRLLRYELGAGIGVVVAPDIGKVVIGEVFPPSSSKDMYGVCVDYSGNIYVSDVGTHVVYEVAEGGRIRVLAGSVGHPGFVNGVSGTAARFNTPQGVCCDRSGNIYVADSANNRLRKIDKDAKVTTICGGFLAPYDCAPGPNGEIYVADTGHHKVYRIEQNGRKLLLAGSGVAGNVSGTVGGVKIKGANAQFRSPMGITVDNTGNVYVCDNGNYQIKKISQDGWVTLFAGTGVQGNVNGNALVAKFDNPIYIKANRTGELFLIDRTAANGVNRVKRIDANGVVSTVSYITGAEALGGGDGALGIAVSPANTLFVVVSAGEYEEESSSSSETSLSSTGGRI